MPEALIVLPRQVVSLPSNVHLISLCLSPDSLRRVRTLLSFSKNSGTDFEKIMRSSWYEKRVLPMMPERNELMRRWKVEGTPARTTGIRRYG